MKGRFVWYDLMTTDPKAAIAFYSDVVGYKTELFSEATGPEPYTMWVASQGAIGGVMALQAEAKAAGTPPHWMAHVEVDDIEATVTLAKAKGGKVLLPPTQIPTIGRFSVIADPHGAWLSAIEFDKSNAPMPSHDTTKHGEFIWNELHAGDAKSAFSFYSELFDWKLLSEMDMGSMGKYMIYGQGDQQYGGMMTKTPDMPAPTWIYYINVDDLDVALARAKAKGANVLYGPTEVPGGTRMVQLTDPQGALFALHGPKAK